MTEGEFTDGTNIKDKPLPYIDVVRSAGVFPRADELWAWAHVHVNRSLAASDGEFVSQRHGRGHPASSQAVLGENPDLAYSRLAVPAEARARTRRITRS